MSERGKGSTSYDDLPYTSFPYPQTHPFHLGALAQLFGLAPAPITECRILELGCAAGGNLIPMAARLPGSQCVGVDASRRQIDDGLGCIESLSLTNIELHHQDVCDFQWSGLPFDYIICHGVYSWVPAATQQRLLAICRDYLAPQGIAFVSYNTYPGWYLRRGVREMMGFHASGFEEAQTKIDQSRALVDFLASAVRTDGDTYEQLLREELSILRASEDSYVYHEHLEKDNEPIFFYEFIQRAETAGLRYLSDAQFSTMIPSDFTESTQTTLRSIAPGIIQMEQYLDFLRNRKFRQSLLCHANVQPDRSIDPSRLANLCVSAPLAEPGQTDSEDAETTFEHSSGQTVSVTDDASAKALRLLSLVWPNSVAMRELVEQTATDFNQVGQTILELFAQGLVSLSAVPVGCQNEVSSHPCVRELVRCQAKRGDYVTNERHEKLLVDEFEKAILAELDGSRDLDGVSRAISTRASNQDGSDLDPDQLRSAIEATLQRFAHCAILIS